MLTCKSLWILQQVDEFSSLSLPSIAAIVAHITFSHVDPVIIVNYNVFFSAGKLSSRLIILK